MKLKFVIFIFVISHFCSVTSIMSQNKNSVETWRKMELSFESTIDYTLSGADKVWMDVIFTHSSTKERIVRPAFWDGANRFLVRFAPTHNGKWEYKTQCPQDKSLDNHSGSFRSKAYKGDLEIYKRGFVTCQAGKKYMTYADGTPFFYLGDTHWGMYREEIDEAGPNVGNINTESHFKYIVDRRAEQGFTVYQSEPIDALFNVRDGKVDASDIDGFRLADRYYEHIASRGLVHANAEFFFSSELTKKLAEDHNALERLSRYWVARFGAYPVMWTLAQEIDNDFYHERGDQSIYNFANNPWVKIAEYIHKYDAYSHPLSAHQENTIYTTVTGRGIDFSSTNADGGGASAFASDEVAKLTGHNWWAAQWSPSLTSPVNSDLVRDYWEDWRPAINYEGRYCGLWTKDFGARAQGWISFLSGFMGYGYGAIDMWLYKSAYNIDTTSHDGIDLISIEDKLKPWSEAIEFESAIQMGYMRNLLESMDWWNLKPILPDTDSFNAEAKAYVYARSEKFEILYFFSKEHATGTINDLRPEKLYKLMWYNPRSGEMTRQTKISSEADGKLKLPLKPDEEDWVVVLKH